MLNQLECLREMRRQWVAKYGTWAHLAQFLVVGSSGLAVNLLVLTALLEAEVAHRIAIVAAIGLSMMWNFALHRRFSFSYARDGAILAQFFWFIAACSLGAVVNYLVTAALWGMFHTKQVAALFGVAAGTAFNFITSRYVVFRKTIRTTPPASTPQR